MKNKLIIFIRRIREHLWFRPLLFCLLSVAAALFAHQADETPLNDLVPEIQTASIEDLLDILSASMLVIAIFAVGSMLSAYSAAGRTATPRSFRIVITDDVSQYALSTFIGAFIFSIVATVALENGYYNKAGKFILFIITLVFFTAVILVFLRWVDRISRLGRLEHTILQVEEVAIESLSNYIKNPLRKGVPIIDDFKNGKPVFAHSTGYLQNINMERLQELAETFDLRVRLNCLPGKFVNENLEIAFVSSNSKIDISEVSKKINEAIEIGHTRLFDEDPRFGLITLTEIASRALSPGINDPGTAIQIIGSHERLFFLWNDRNEEKLENKVVYDRVEVPEIEMNDFFDDAFKPISRDGSGFIEVMLRMQKVFSSLDTINHSEIKSASKKHSKYAFTRAVASINVEDDLKILKKVALFK
ncbi:DUF2254 domain-containing protein [Tamlana sp. 2_MG-2023]|uniref:DUF2254 domain-containing protein n=1 Tax=unclassified Tamlana TaxID=2614803 RepID=UPI0026E31355|nr:MULTISPECIES: DUF2254 domain-containing protein [unclassified Tamlana]MDO6760746.1 DUF2254 domain-containing protein [Tamlana sp. 2_MG-2023]MDO6791002.1 DUF2254 domain-containing protein [Tamlana sp. 1_MG-2023]